MKLFRHLLQGNWCFTIKAPKLRAIGWSYDMMSINYSLKLVQEQQIESVQFLYFYLEQYGGAFVAPFAHKIHKAGGLSLSIQMVWNEAWAKWLSQFKLILNIPRSWPQACWSGHCGQWRPKGYKKNLSLAWSKNAFRMGRILQLSSAALRITRVWFLKWQSRKGILFDCWTFLYPEPSFGNLWNPKPNVTCWLSAIMREFLFELKQKAGFDKDSPQLSLWDPILWSGTAPNILIFAMATVSGTWTPGSSGSGSANLVFGCWFHQ